MKRVYRITRFLLFFVLAIFFRNTSKAQETDSLLNGLRVEIKGQRGYVYPHTSAIQYLLRENIGGVELTFSTRSNGRHPWEKLYRYPRYGVGYNYTTFGNRDILGSAHAFFSYFDVPFVKAGSRLTLNYQIGFGMGVMSKKYNIEENPLNLAIGSSLNAFVSVDLICRYKVSDRNEVKAALELSHYSNGKMRSPNMGLNTVTASFAWLYSVIPERKIKVSPEPVGYKKHIAEIFWNAGGKRDDYLNNRIYLISSVVGDYNYALSPKYAVGGGFDLMYDQALEVVSRFQGDEEADYRYNRQAGLHLGFRVRYGRFHLVGHFGHYLYYYYLKYSPFYTRLGLRYNLTEQFIFNFTLKAHYAIADYVEWGLGYRFKTRGI